MSPSNRRWLDGRQFYGNHEAIVALIRLFNKLSAEGRGLTGGTGSPRFAPIRFAD